MGLLAGFIEGAAKTGADTITKETEQHNQANVDADAQIREKIASVQPTEEVSDHEADHKAAIEASKQKLLVQQRASDFPTFMQSQGTQPAVPNQSMQGDLGNSNSSMPAGLDNSTSQAAPIQGADGSITSAPLPPLGQSTGSSGAPPIVPPTVGTGTANGFSTGTPSRTTSPAEQTLDSMLPKGITPVHADGTPMEPVEKYATLLAAAGRAEDRGDTKQAAALRLQADGYKTLHDDETKEAANKGKPIEDAAGVKIVDKLTQDTETHITKDPAAESQMLPKKLAESLANPDAADRERHSVNNIAAPLMQSVISAKKDANPQTNIDSVYGPIKTDIVKQTQNINTINSSDDKITPDDKKAAARDFNSYMRKTFGSDNTISKRIASDTNLQTIFNPEFVNNLREAQRPTKSNDSISSPTGTPSSSTQAPITATNPKTGEKAIFQDGKWQIQPNQQTNQ